MPINMDIKVIIKWLFSLLLETIAEKARHHDESASQ